MLDRLDVAVFVSQDFLLHEKLAVFFYVVIVFYDVYLKVIGGRKTIFGWFDFREGSLFEKKYRNCLKLSFRAILSRSPSWNFSIDLWLNFDS